MLTRFKFLSILLIALIAVTPAAKVYAIDNSYYRSNDVLFYNPEDNNFFQQAPHLSVEIT
jgi:hypothetical protein